MWQPGLAVGVAVALAFGIWTGSAQAQQPQNDQAEEVDAGTQALEADLDRQEAEQEEAEARQIWLGKLRIRPHLNFSGVYDDNIYIASDSAGKTADYVFTISPGMGAGAGDFEARTENFVYVDYTPGVVIFEKRSDSDATEHDARLDGQYRFAKLVVGLNQSYVSASGALVDAGGRTTRQIYTTGVRGTYEISPKTTWTSQFRQTITDYQTLYDSVEWYNQNWVDYEIMPKTRLGVGLNFGWLEVDRSVDQEYQQLMSRIDWKPTDKISIQARGGVEYRQADEGKDSFNPVFGLGGSYRPFDGTSVNLDGYRREMNSASQFAHNMVTTGFTMGVRQRFLQKFFVTVNGGYDETEYRGVLSSILATREDEYWFIKPGVESDVTDFLKLSLFYQYRENNSTVPASSFNNNQVGFQAKLLF